MVFIIGVDHLVQYNGPVPEYILEEFRAFLACKVRELNISLIAEEFNEEFLRDVLGATEDTAKTVADQTGAAHLYCDPDEREREMLGIPYYADVMDMVKKRRGITARFIFDDGLRRCVERETAGETKKYWHIREKFWLGKIKESLDRNILFICGHEHVESFSWMLRENGAEVSVIDDFWNRKIFSDYGLLGLK